MKRLAPTLASLLVCLGCSTSGLPASETPNIIFIMADDLGYADMGSFGGTVIQTPNLDRIAAAGARFTQAYAGSPVCAPSRSTLMTGLHTGHTTVRGNFGKEGGVVGLGGGQGRVPLNKEDVTVAELLKEAGYVTGITGKWGLGEPHTTGHPNLQGFDSWFGYLNQRRAHSYYPDYLWRDSTRVPLEGNQNGGRRTYSHDLIAEFALSFIEQNQDTSFFLYLPFTIPHAAFEVPDSSLYADQPWRGEEIAYAAMVSRMDADIGRLLDLLDELALTHNTLLFFCSDNGAVERWEGRFDSSGPLRGRKRDLYEGGIRTPLLVQWPGHVPAGSVNETPLYFPDILPTLAHIAGATPPAELDGINIAGVLVGETTLNPDRVMYWEFYERGFQQALRWRHWKAVKLSPDAAWELYNLERDLGETNDLSADYPELIAFFETEARKQHSPSAAWPAPIDP